MKRNLFTIKVLGLFSLTLFTFSACNNSQNTDIVEVLDLNKYNEDNYKFNTINLWGSEAAVIDSGDYYIFQGDIYLDKKDILAENTRGASRIDKRWPNNIVYYTFDNIPEGKRECIYKAMSEIEWNSYITFVPRLNGESNYINFKLSGSDGASSSYIGCSGKEQTIKLSNSVINYNLHGTVIHELCHALGLYHEMCRTDRDNYVKIDFSRLTTDKSKHQYKKYTELKENGVDVGTFDFHSIMMYPSDYNDGELYVPDAMLKLNGERITVQRNSLSTGDINALAKAQPASLYTFYEEQSSVGNIDGPYVYRRMKYLRCPEGADINFKFQQKFSPNKNNYGQYTLDDFDISTTIRIINRNTNDIALDVTIPIEESSTYVDYLYDVHLSPGQYTVNMFVEGKVLGTATSAKYKVLETLMYSPIVYFHLNSVKINGINITIPSDLPYSADLRNKTFIAII